MAFIYRITNLVNGKKYIGQTTCKDAMLRWKGHQKAFKQGRGCPFLKKAVEKHGLENFKFEVILECTDEERHEKERELIETEMTLLPYGYNMLLGGNDGFFRKHHTAEVRHRIGEISRRVKSEMSEEKKKEINKRISESNKKAKANISAETRAKISKSKKGIKISELTKAKISKSLRRFYSIDNSNKISESTRLKMSEAAKKRKENGKGVRFTEEMKKNHKDVMTRAIGIKVDQYTMDGVYMKTFPSKASAERELGLYANSIHRVIVGLRKTAGGFIWKRHEETTALPAIIEPTETKDNEPIV